MSYTEAEKENHIDELRGYLCKISLINKKIPKISSNGKYDLEITNAVKAFQNEFNLPVTGETDVITWNKILQEYNRIEFLFSSPMSILPFRMPCFEIKLGDKSVQVYIIQAVINSIAEKFDNITTVSVSGEFDTKTQNAVKFFQSLCEIEETGTVNRKTWDMLAKTFNLL